VYRKRPSAAKIRFKKQVLYSVYAKVRRQCYAKISFSKLTYHQKIKSYKFLYIDNCTIDPKNCTSTVYTACTCIVTGSGPILA